MPRKTPVPEVPEFDAAEKTAAELDPEMYATDGQFTEVPAEKEKEPVPEPQPIRALVPKASAADHHLVVGMATLANMSEEDFQAKIAVMKKARERIETVQRDLMTEGVDYGKVPGIARPFLHQPGAEFLTNLYGFAVRQEVERITRKIDDAPEVPPYAYHVKSFVHLGDTDGPVVAEGAGEANPYEDKYHYRWAQQGCPVCGKVGTIIARKTPPAMAGKKQCANFGNKDGCGTVFEATDPRLAPAEKEPTPDMDLFGLAETILQMAAKRSLVAAVRRATGTSGLFTQDDDSPSVQRQSAESAPEAQGNGASAPVVEAATAPTSQPGGNPTQVQHDRLKVLAKEKGLKGADIAELLNRLFGLSVEATGAAAGAAVKNLTADQLGVLLAFIETGDLSSLGELHDDAYLNAIAPDDIGAK